MQVYFYTNELQVVWLVVLHPRDKNAVNVIVFAALADQIMASVMAGQRPNIALVQGPEEFVDFVKWCIQICWMGEPYQRPTFGGEIFSFYYSASA